MILTPNKVWLTSLKGYEYVPNMKKNLEKPYAILFQRINLLVSNTINNDNRLLKVEYM